jgi:hypothetical protein
MDTVTEVPGLAEFGDTYSSIGEPTTLNPLISDSCSVPVCADTVRVASGALPEMVSCAVAVVALVTVTGPNAPETPVPTAIPGPKLATVVPFTKWVFCAVMVTVSVWPAREELGATERSVGTAVDAVTVSVVLPEMAPLVALIVVLPAFSADAKPALLIVAVVVLDDAHVALAVRFCVELSLYVPVAVNCCVPPAATDGFTGVTAIDTSVAAVTASVVLPEMAPLVALIVVLPAFSAEAKPALLIVAVVVLDDAHVTLAVMFCVELSL